MNNNNIQEDECVMVEMEKIDYIRGDGTKLAVDPYASNGRLDSSCDDSV